METLRFHYFNNSYQKHKSSDFILINKKKKVEVDKEQKKKELKPKPIKMSQASLTFLVWLKQSMTSLLQMLIM